MSSEIFPVLILIARPAAGKSEIIDYLKKTPEGERVERFHIGTVEEFDDFLYVWEKFEEDDLLSKHGKPRVWTDSENYFKDDFLWNLFIEKLSLAVAKRARESPELFRSTTALVEFSRGGERGFEEAFNYLSREILEKAAIVYIRVSYEESVRKNRRRARPQQLHSVLHHSLPDEKMEYYYKTNDWDRLEARHPSHISIQGIDVPYAVLENEPEVTDRPEKLGPALENVLQRLWKEWAREHRSGK